MPSVDNRILNNFLCSSNETEILHFCPSKTIWTQCFGWFSMPFFLWTTPFSTQIQIGKAKLKVILQNPKTKWFFSDFFRLCFEMVRKICLLLIKCCNQIIWLQSKNVSLWDLKVWIFVIFFEFLNFQVSQVSIFFIAIFTFSNAI